MISTSLDWENERDRLYDIARRLPHNDVKIMLDSIYKLVRELGLEEIEMRRKHVTTNLKFREKLVEINQRIEDFEGQVIFALLCKT